MKRQWVRKTLMLTLALTMVLPLLAACTKKEEAVPTGQERVLRIGIQAGGNDNSWFRQQYVEAFEMANPGVRIEIVPAVNYEDSQFEDPATQKKKQVSMKESWKKVLEGANPVDIVLTDNQSFRQLANDGMLAKLDERILQDKFDTSDIVPAVYEGIKSMGNGAMYGLAPTFSSQALLYNKKLFQDAGVELPKDGMTWDEVFTLAQRVTKGEGKDRKYGLSFDRYMGGEAYWSLQNYTAPLQLQKYDNKLDKMTVDSPKWAEVWEKTAKLYKDKIIPSQEAMMMDVSQTNPSPFSHDLFLSGKLAMVVADTGYLNSDVASAMRNASKIKNFKSFEWDVVTMPYHTEAPNVSGSISINTIFSINAKAPNPDDAWNFIKYVNSEQWAKVRSRSSSWEMVTRKSYIKPAEGLDYNIEAFYNVKPITTSNQDQFDLIMKYQDLHYIDQLGGQMFNQVIEGKKSTKEALKEWETKGNEMLQKIKKGVAIVPEGVPGGVYN